MSKKHEKLPKSETINSTWITSYTTQRIVTREQYARMFKRAAGTGEFLFRVALRSPNQQSLIFKNPAHAAVYVVMRAVERLMKSTLGIIRPNGRPRENSSVKSSPPRAAKFLLLLIPLRHREGVIGDLEEEYNNIVLPRYGPLLAGIYFWWHAILCCIVCIFGAVRAILTVSQRRLDG